MKKTKRILALIGAILLGGLYIATLIAAFTASPHTANFFNASLFCSMFIPIMIYAYTLIMKVLKHDHTLEEKSYPNDSKTNQKK